MAGRLMRLQPATSPAYPEAARPIVPTPPRPVNYWAYPGVTQAALYYTPDRPVMAGEYQGGPSYATFSNDSTLFSSSFISWSAA